MNMEGSGVQKKRLPAPLIALIVLLVLLVILAVAAVGAYLGLCHWVQTNDRLLPGAVAVDDDGAVVAELGGLLREDAVARISQAMDRRLQAQTLTIRYGDGSTVTLSGNLLAYSPEAAVARGMSVKEDQPFWRLGLLWLGLAEEPVSMSLSTTDFSEEGAAKARQLAQQIAQEVYQAPADYTYELSEDAITVVRGTDGREALVDTLPEDILAALTEGRTQLTVDTRTLPCEQPPSAQFFYDLVYTPPQAPQPAENGGLTPGVSGVSINSERAQALLDSIGPGESCTIPLVYISPYLSEQEDYLYQDVLSSVTTKLDGVAARSHNVAQAAASCNEVIIMPGEVFSYLGAIGSPSIANGYQMSTGYSGGQTVDMVGGGICQVSSSIYYCAVYANLEIVNRANHAFDTGYIPRGLDATVYYPSLDFKFRNNTDFPIKIVAFTQGGASGTLTVRIYGTKTDGTRVKTEINELSTTPWTTVYKPDESIPRGTTKVSVTPYTGYTVEVYRCVYDEDGNLISRTYENTSRYSKRDKVILYNPLDSGPWGPGIGEPEPEPSDDPVVTPEPEPSDDPVVAPEPEPSDGPVVTPEPGPSEDPEVSADPGEELE